jgi:zinc transport system ATP-binding protein
MALIKCEDLVLGYDKSLLVEGLNFHIMAGEHLCIVGENGSGKSTLMRTLLRQNKPISGKISYGDGLDARQMGYLPQQTQIQKDFPASAFEIVLSGCLNSCKLFPFYSKKQKRLAKEKMELLRISDLETRCYRELSGGQQQRVLLARALCATEKLILLDEPVAGLDPESTLDMYNAIDALKNDGIAVIMISHDAKEALSHATHVLHVAHKPKFFGKVEDYLESDAYRAFIKGGRK